MQIEEFMTVMENRTPETHANIGRIIELMEADDRSHVKWLEAWHTARDGYSESDDDTPEEKGLYLEYDALAFLLATPPTQASEDMVAQIEWLKEDLGEYIIGSVFEPYKSVFDVPIESAQQISRPAIN